MENTTRSPLVLQVLRPAAGGMLRHVAAVCAGMAARGVACTVAGPVGILHAYSDSLAVSVDVPIHGSLHPLKDMLAIARIARAARSHDLIHAHGLRAAWLACWAAQLSRTPIIMTAHNMPEALTGARRWALVRSSRVARAVVAVSCAVAEGLTECGVSRERIVVVPNGVAVPPNTQPKQREALGLDQTAFVVIGAGRLSREKGFDVLIASLWTLSRARPDATLILCGAGPEHGRLMRQAEAAGISDRVHFAGYVQDLDSWLCVADAVAVPSRSEGQGLVALEAMALGLPVVAARVGGLPEVIQDGESGLLVPPEDPDALAHALAQLAGAPELRRRLGAAGRRRVQERFSMETMLDRLEQLYRAAA